MRKASPGSWRTTPSLEEPARQHCVVTQITLAAGRPALVHRYNSRRSTDPWQGRVHNNSNRPEPFAVNSDRRRPADRRKRILRALIHGSFNPRRQGSRRDGEHSFTAVDWHHPQWLAVAMLTLIMCVADALLTLVLLQRGAYEANPFMALLVDGSPLAFAIIKFGLTAGGLVVLILLARVRLFRKLPVAAVLYAVLLSYAALIGYELWLIEALFDPA